MTLDDRLHPVREALAAVWPTQGRQFVTFEAHADDDAWVQYIDGQINLSWPLDEDPRTALPRLGVALPRGSFPGVWTAGRAAILYVGDVLLDDVAALVLALFDRCLASDRPAALRVRLERV